MAIKTQNLTLQIRTHTEFLQKDLPEWYLTLVKRLDETTQPGVKINLSLDEDSGEYKFSFRESHIIDLTPIIAAFYAAKKAYMITCSLDIGETMIIDITILNSK
ncbi:MAG: hypothetical protein ACXVC2_12665 [Bacteroidia bacterium]